MKTHNSGGYLLRNWVIKGNDKSNNAKISNFNISTKTKSPTGDSGATSLHLIGHSFMNIETSSFNNGDNVFCSFERTDNIQISNITIYYNRFSAGSTKSTGRFRIQMFSKDNTCTTQHNISKNDRYSDSSTEWTLVNLNFIVENYGIKLLYDEVGSAHANMCFSKITITHSIY